MSKTAIQQMIEFCEQNVSVQSEQMGLEYKTLDYDKVIAKLTELKEVEKQNIDELLLQRDELLELLKTFTICMDLGETENLENCCKTSKELIIKIEKCKIK